MLFSQPVSFKIIELHLVANSTFESYYIVLEVSEYDVMGE